MTAAGLGEDRATRLRSGTLINRRDYLRMLVLASGGLLLGTAGLASGLFRRHGSGAGRARLVAPALEPGQMLTFSYPGDDDPVIGMRLSDGSLVAFSSVCTHLSCAVLWRRAEGVLECPCHNGTFDERTGEVVAGPPPRALTSIQLEQRGDGIYAVGSDE